MKAYLDIVQRILKQGELKENRTGIDTLTLPNQVFSHDMSMGFPLLTTKKMAVKAMAVELEGFIKGITSKQWFIDRKCKIWSQWANPRAINKKITSGYYTEEFLNDPDFQKKAQLEEDDLGPLGYSWQWRRFGEIYDEDDNGCNHGYDQLAYIIYKLKNNPNDRRMYCTAANPNQRHLMALEPCHILWVITHINGQLNL